MLNTKHKLERNTMRSAVPDSAVGSLHMCSYTMEEAQCDGQRTPHRYQLITHQPLEVVLDRRGCGPVTLGQSRKGAGGG